MQWIVGTSGFSYKPWKGVFYPAGLPDGEMLRFYASRLPGVELDNTFYRLPKRAVIESWREQVPEGFKFTLKASRRITHFARLKNAEEPTGFLIANVRVLGERLGAVLFQLPPNLKKDVGRLGAFLEHVPPDVPSAFEFREPSWFDPEVYDLLRSRGVALCLADTEETPDPELVETARFGYLRLRREVYDAAALARWVERVSRTSWETAYVFFKHEDGGVGPVWADALLREAGVRRSRA